MRATNLSKKCVKKFDLVIQLFIRSSRLYSKDRLKIFIGVSRKEQRMSNNDLWIRDVITSYGLLSFVFIAIVISISRKWSNLKKRIYKAYLTGFEVECAELMIPYKKLLFKSLQHVLSRDKVLRSMGCIRLLEIGIKTGVHSTYGGQYMFIEHIPENEETFLRWLQKILSQTKIWPSLFGGCHLDIDPVVNIKSAGFNHVTWDIFTLDGYVSHPFHLILSRQHVLGMAIR